VPADITLSSNDTETCELGFSIINSPAHGSLSPIGGSACAPGAPNADTASVTYTPNPGFNGQDTFTYKTNDGTLDSSPATVTITVAGNTAPVANPTSASTYGLAVGLSLSGSDPEACELAFSIVSGPAHGSLSPIGGAACAPGSPNADTASVTYTPNPGFSGVDAFTYKVSDGVLDSNAATATITVGGTLYSTKIHVTKGKLTSGAVGNLAAQDGSYATFLSTSGKNALTEWNGVMIMPTVPTALSVSYFGLNSASALQTISIFNFVTGKWVVLDTRTVGTTLVAATNLIPPGAASQYRKKDTHEVRVRIHTNHNGTFNSSADLLAVTYQ
jgi:hypothetical protein